MFADVGGFAGVVKSFTVTSDSNLDIDFLHVIQNPSIKGIEIVDGTVQAARWLPRRRRWISVRSWSTTRRRNVYANQ